MPAYCEHDITLASFAQIDREIGPHRFTSAEYAVARRVVHTTADFEFVQRLRFANRPMAAAANALRQKATIVTDVSMVAAGIRSVAARTWNPAVVSAIQRAPTGPEKGLEKGQKKDPGHLPPGQTRSAAGMQQCIRDCPGAIFAVGNAPTALLALCQSIEQSIDSGQEKPALVVGVPVGFINVVESKQALAALAVPHILVTGRKGGSAVAAAILNALMIWTWEQS